MGAFRDAVRQLVESDPPMTVRQAFYRAVAAGLVRKTDGDYDAIGNALLWLRRNDALAWSAITDGTRWQRRVTTYSSVEDALRQTARFYRRNLWQQQQVSLEVWTEKDALSGVIWPVVEEFDVPLMVSKGFASETYLHAAAEQIVADRKPVHIGFLGDHDPSGVLIDKVIEGKLRRFAPRAEIHFERLAVRPDQIAALGLPTRPTKRDRNPHAKGFVGDSVEVDAIPPAVLRGLVHAFIMRHIDRRQLMICRAAERSEREALTCLLNHLGEATSD